MSRPLACSLLGLLGGIAAAVGPGESLRSAAGARLGFRPHVFAPHGEAFLPVIFFVSGFAGDTPIFTYSELLNMVAARGFVVVGLDRLSVPNYPKQAGDFLAVLEWAQAGHLKTLMKAQGLAATPDIEKRSVVMGHSAGNHIIGQALEDRCSLARAWVLLDPVDGYDPYRMVTSQDLIRPGHKLNFSIPSLILDSGLDPRPSGHGPACDPPVIGTPRWFPALRGPVWNVNATAYGHIDCLNAIFDKNWLCASDPYTNKTAYHEFIADTASLFLRSIFDGRQADLAVLSDPSHFKVAVTVKQDLKGLAPSDIVPGCARVAPKTNSDVFADAGPTLLI